MSANPGTDRTTTRRRALQLGSIGALAAGLMGTTAPVSATVVPQTAPVLGTVTNMADIVAEVREQIETVRAADRAVQDTQDALVRTLNAEQRALFMAYEDADNDRDFEQMDLYVLDLGRHLPGLHPAIWALWRHLFESKQGECCMPNSDSGPY